MAGYNDTRELIIQALMGRPAGTEIQPENHQAYALNMLDYIRSIELVSSSTLIGYAEANTTPVQPNTGKVTYIAGVAQNQNVTYVNFRDFEGNPINISTGEMEAVFIILFWNTEYWTAYSFPTNIISNAENANFYYNINIRKTYNSVSAMNADTNPIGDDGRTIKIGELVAVVDSSIPSENAFYRRIDNGWEFLYGFGFIVRQEVGTSVNDTMSQNSISLFFDRQVKDYNSSYVFKGFCVANQAAPSTPSANDVYLYTGSVTATVFGIANVPAKNYLVYSGTAWTIVNPYIPKPLSSKGTSVNDTMSQNAISNELNQLATDEAAMVPSIQFNKRVIADSGSIKDKSALFESYRTALNLLPNTVLAYSPEMGVKQSVSGLVYKASKLYDMSPVSNDANQATAGLQPYLGGNIAPNERMWVWGTNKALPFTPIAFSGTSKWSVSFVVDITAISGLGTKSILHASAPIISLTSYNNLTFRDKTNNLNNFTYNLSQLPKISRFYLVAKGDNTLSLYINGVLNATLNIANTTEATFNQIFWSFENPKLYSLRILNKDLSKSEIENLDKFLSNIYLEYETTAIGSQAWLTSNHIGNVTSDGFVIPEVQPNNSSVTYLSNFASGIDSFEAISNSSLSGNNDSILGIDDTLKWTVVASGASNLRKAITIPYGAFKVSFDYYIPNTCSINRLLVTDYGASGNYLDTNISGFTKGSWVTVTGNINITAGIATTGLKIYAYNGVANDEIYIKNFKVENMGWADSQTIYDNNIAAGKSVVEASKAAAMWCKINHSDDNAAVYGYLYNWWAAYLFWLYPPKGLRVPIKADQDQKVTTLGGSTVAGGKLKKEGLSYWTSPNAGATNESGFSMLGSGFRNADGSFSGSGTLAPIWSATPDGSTTAMRLYLQASQNIAVQDATHKTRGFALRFLKNAPVAESQNIIRTTGKFPTDIVSGAKSIQIPFGFRVTSIVITSSTNLTNIEAKLFDAAGVERTLLLTQKVCNSTSLVFQVLGDQPILLQDPTVRVTAKNNGGDGMTIDVLATQVIF